MQEAPPIQVRWQTKASAKHPTALLGKGTSQLLRGWPLTLRTWHQLQSVTENKGRRTMTGGRFIKYHLTLPDTPELTPERSPT